jgi:two-component sensor histidine kinase
MEAIILTKDEFQRIQNELNQIKQLLEQKQKNTKDIFLDNQEFVQAMNISKRTAQNWRDEGVISFSQVGGKIYYRLSDIEKMLEKNYNPAFK